VVQLDPTYVKLEGQGHKSKLWLGLKIDCKVGLIVQLEKPVMAQWIKSRPEL